MIPLESNPDVMTELIHKMGVPAEWSITDVMSLEPENLCWLPQPVAAMIFLYPIKDNDQASSEVQKDENVKPDQEVSPNVFYMVQTVSNVCGTVALIHSILNNLDQIELEDGSLKKFYADAKDLSPEERGKLLEEPSNEIVKSHGEFSRAGQTEAPDEHVPVYYHFVAFVEKDGHLYELDGRKGGLIKRGPTTKDGMTEAAAKVCREYMEKNPNELRYSTVALVKSGAKQ